MQTALADLTEEVRRLARLIEGESGRFPINRGLLGAIEDLTHTDTKLDRRVTTLEEQWTHAKWAIIGAAAGGGLLGSVGIDLLRRAMGI